MAAAQVSFASVPLFYPGVLSLCSFPHNAQFSYSTNPDRWSTCLAQTLLSGTERGREDAMEMRNRFVRSLEGNGPACSHLWKSGRQRKTEREKARDEIQREIKTEEVKFVVVASFLFLFFPQLENQRLQ